MKKIINLPAIPLLYFPAGQYNDPVNMNTLPDLPSIPESF
jgi:hypothetical protein